MLNAQDAQKKVFSGWKMVIIAALCLTFIGNFWSNAMTVTNAMMMKDPNNQISATVYGFGYTIFLILFAAGSQFAGFINDKKGTKVLFITAAVCAITAGLGLSNWVNQGAIMFILTYSVVGGFGYTFSGGIATTSIVCQWFIKSRGKANSIVNFGTAFAGIITPPIVTWIIAQTGRWQMGHYFYGVSSIIGLILALFIINRPSDVGQFPDGIDPMLQAEGAARAGEEPKKSYISKVYKNINPANHYTYKQAIRTPMFWMATLVQMLTIAAGTFMMNPGAVLFTSTGWDMATIAGILSIRQIFRIAFLLLCVRYMDRIEPVKILAGASIFTAVAYVLSTNATNYWQVLLFYIAGSVMITAYLAIPGVIVANYFGNTHLAKILGSVMLIAYLVASFSSLLTGYLKDITGTYIPGYYIWSGASILAFIICLWINAHTAKTKMMQQQA